MIDSPKSNDLTAKAEKLAAEALGAGKKFVETDAGKRVAEATDTAFATAGEMGKKLAESDLGKKALESELGKQVVEFAKRADGQTRATITNELARNVAVGAAAGAVVALPIPFIGSLFGAVIGAGLGYLRTITKKS